MSRFRDLKEKNDSKALRKDKKIGTKAKDIAAQGIFSESFFEFQGMSQDYSFLLDLKYQLALLQIKYLEGKGRHYLNQIVAKEVQIKEQEKKLKGGMSIGDAKTFIEDRMKVFLNLEQITVEDFYNKLNYYGRKH